ncbi:MAG: carbohydrate binding domain-containing protein [Elusimicrobia bacterium]|nr:carbohydrate binding domain-containing protein [Elusimicrobiota bacterium]
MKRKYLSIVFLAGIVVSCICTDDCLSETSKQQVKKVQAEKSKNTSGNLIRNPGAEDDIDWWSSFIPYQNAISWGTTDKEAHTGKKSAYLVLLNCNVIPDDMILSKPFFEAGLIVGKSTGTYYRCIAPEGYQVKPNTKYYFSFWLKGKGFTGGLSVVPWGFDDNGSSCDRFIKSTLDKKIVTSDYWTEYKGYFTMKETTKKIVLVFYVNAKDNIDATQGATFYVDDVYIGLTEPK